MAVNENGLRQIRDVLIRYSQYGSAYEVFDKHDIGLRQFASTVESQLRAGHPPTFDLKAHETKSGHAETHEISRQGINFLQQGD